MIGPRSFASASNRNWAPGVPNRPAAEWPGNINTMCRQLLHGSKHVSITAAHQIGCQQNMQNFTYSRCKIKCVVLSIFLVIPCVYGKIAKENRGTSDFIKEDPSSLNPFQQGCRGLHHGGLPQRYASYCLHQQVLLGSVTRPRSPCQANLLRHGKNGR